MGTVVESERGRGRTTHEVQLSQTDDDRSQPSKDCRHIDGRELHHSHGFSQTQALCESVRRQLPRRRRPSEGCLVQAPNLIPAEKCMQQQDDDSGEPQGDYERKALFRHDLKELQRCRLVIVYRGEAITRPGWSSGLMGIHSARHEAWQT